MGPTLVIDRRGKHGRRRSRRLALRQVSERARSRRQAQHRVAEAVVPNSVAEGSWARLQPFMLPVRPDGKVIR